jgi:hypothetical protein
MLTGLLSYHSSVVKVPLLRRGSSRETPRRAHTPETKPPPDRGGKPTHILPSKVSSMLAVCLLDSCSRHSKCRFVSTEHSTTPRRSCQDQKMCFTSFLRPSAALYLQASCLDPAIRRSVLTLRIKPVISATLLCYYIGGRLSNRLWYFTHHTAATPPGLLRGSPEEIPCS